MAFAAALLVPLSEEGWYRSHEGLTYLERTHQVLRNWQAGVALPRWCPDLYGGYGAPFFVFYSPLFFLTAAAFLSLSVSVTTAVKLAVLVFAVLGALGAFLWLQSETHRHDAALVGAVGFVAAPHTLIDVYVRGDLAEAAAIQLLPWATWALRRLARPGVAALSLDTGLAGLAVAGVLVTHTVTGLFLAYWAVILVVVAGARRPRAAVRTLHVYSVAGLFAVALSAFYAVPAFTERQHVRTELMIEGFYAVKYHAVELLRLLPFYEQLVLGEGFAHKNLMGGSVGVGVVAALVAAFALVARRRPGSRRALSWGLGTVVVVVLMTAVASSLWSLLPFWEYAQFPSRLLGFVALLGAATAALSWRATLRRPSLGAAIVAAVVVVLAVAPHAQFIGGMRPLAFSAADVVKRVSGSTEVDEYLPRGVAQKPSAVRTSVVERHSEGLVVREAAARGLGAAVTVDAPTASTLTFALHMYPGFVVHTVAGPAAVTLVPDESGLVTVSVPAAGRYDLVVAFESTPLRRASSLVSLGALLLLAATGVWRWRRRPQRRAAPAALAR